MASYYNIICVGLLIPMFVGLVSAGIALYRWFGGRRTADIWICTLLVVLAAHTGAGVLAFSGWKPADLIRLPLSWMLVAGPMLSWYYRNATVSAYAPGRRDLLWLAPAVLQVFALLLVWLVQPGTGSPLLRGAALASGMLQCCGFGLAAYCGATSLREFAAYRKLVYEHFTPYRNAGLAWLSRWLWLLTVGFGLSGLLYGCSLFAGEQGNSVLELGAYALPAFLLLYSGLQSLTAPFLLPDSELIESNKPEIPFLTIPPNLMPEELAEEAMLEAGEEADETEEPDESPESPFPDRGSGS